MTDRPKKLPGSAVATVVAAIIGVGGAIWTTNIQWNKQREASRIEAEHRFILKGIGHDQAQNAKWLSFLITAGLVTDTEKLIYIINNPDEIATVSDPKEFSSDLASSEPSKMLVLALSSSNTGERLTAFSRLMELAKDKKKATSIIDEIIETNINGYRSGISSPNGLYNSIVFLNALPSQTIHSSPSKDAIKLAITNLLTTAENSNQIHVGKRTREKIDQLEQRL